MPTYERFEDLPLWQEAIRLAEEVEFSGRGGEATLVVEAGSDRAGFTVGFQQYRGGI